MSPVGRLLQQHPHWAAARSVLDTLANAGHEALLAGGCVRDACLGTTAQDLDVATSATPDEIIALFAKTVEVGKSFGVVRVLEGGADLEVATFRRDGNYQDGRRPDTVHFTNAREDALRRDFTVNALFYDVVHDRIDDYVGGVEDLNQRILRTVGAADRRFEEDHLRLLRAVRFAVQLEFAVEERTWDEVRRLARTILSVSGERVRDELGKMFKKGGELAQILLFESGLGPVLFPELNPFERELREGASKLAVCPSSKALDYLIARWLAPVVFEHPSFDPTALLARLKLSRADTRAIRRRLEVIAHPELVRAGSFGGRILAYDEASVREAWDFIEVLGGADPERAGVHGAWTAAQVDGRLPRPLLNGEDLKSQWTGALLGEALRAVYEAQLEGKFRDREGALTWARAWTKIG